MKKNVFIALFVLLFLSGCSNEVTTIPTQMQVAEATDIMANDWGNNQHYRLNEREKSTLFALLKGEYQTVRERAYKKILQDEQTELPYSFHVKGNPLYVDVLRTDTTYFIGIESMDTTYMLEISNETYAELKQFVRKLEHLCSEKEPCT